MRGRNTALVTGASSGLGTAFADDLARRGHDLVLTARNAAALESLATRLRASHGVDVLIEPADLSDAGGAAALTAALDKRGVAPKVLINNAGIGLNERLTAHDPARLAAMLQLNIGTPTELTRIYGQRMAAAGGGHILLVASLAGYTPAPLMAAYAASKAYIVSLGEALHVELAPKVGVTVLSPGYMETGFDAAAGFEPSPATRRTALAPATVAAIGLNALFGGKPSVVAGTVNRLAALMTRLVPRGVLARLVLRSMGDRFEPM